jgi:hypothetical protein
MKTMSKHFLVIVLLLILPNTTSAEPQTGKQLNSAQIQALDIVRERIQADKLYSSWTTIECLSFPITEESDYFYVAIHEKHGGACPGDPLTFPVVDRFRVHQKSGKIDWYDVTEGEYVPYENVKKFRLKK